MLFKPLKKQNTKEFMKYEDGKIITMEVEKPRKPDTYIEQDYEMQEEHQLKNMKEMSKEKIKPFMTLKVAKKLGLFIVLILFFFALYDVYKNFFGTVPEETPPSTIVEEQPNAPSPTLPEETTNLSPPTTGNHSSLNEPSNSTNETHPLAKAFEVISTVNNIVVEETSSEVQQVKNYTDRKANKVGTARQIEKSLKKKEDLFVYLSTNKELFTNYPLSDLYSITEERLLSSILFSKELHSGIQQMIGRDSLLSMTDEFIPKDEEIRKRGIESMLTTLDHFNVPHQYNEATEEIQYSLK